MTTNIKHISTKKTPLLWISFVSFSLAIFLFLLIFIEGATISSTIILFYLVGIIFYALLLVLGKKWIASRLSGGSIWLHPPLLINTWWILAYLLPGLYVLTQKNTYNTLNAWITVRSDYAVKGIFVFLVGLLALWVIYGFSVIRLPSLKILKRLSQRPLRLRSAILAYIVGVTFYFANVSIAGVAYGSDTSRYGSLAMLLGYFQDIRLLAIAIIAVQVFKGKWSRGPLVGVVIIELLLGFSSGFMKPIFIIGVILLLSAISANVTIKMRIGLSLILTIIIALIIVIPVAENLRYQINTGRLESNDIVQVINATNQAIEKSWVENPRESLLFSIDRFTQRQSFISYTPGLIMQLTPSIIPYQGITGIIAAPMYVIPRIIWNNKPILTKGRWFSVVYIGQPDSTKSSSAMTFFGEGYVASGLLGVILVGIYMGIITAFWYKNLIPTGLAPVFITVLPNFIDIEGDFTSAFIYAIQAPIFFIFVYWLITISFSKKRHLTGARK